MEATHSTSDSQRAFYLPASSVSATGPSRLERFLTQRLSDSSGRRSGPSVRAPVRAFYLPATAGSTDR